MLPRRSLEPDRRPDRCFIASLPRMTSRSLSLLRVSVTAVAVVAGAAAALGQSEEDRSPGFLDGLFGRGDQGAAAHQAGPNRDKVAQSSTSEMSVRIDRLEAQIRQMTGTIEELQYRNQQLIEQLRRVQEDGAQQSSAQPPRPAGAPVAAAAPPNAPGAPAGAAVVAAAPPVTNRPTASPPTGRRDDAFDPAQNPTAPGAPRTLGALPAGSQTPPPAQSPDQVAEGPPVGAPGGRVPGEPLNLSTMGGNSSYDPRSLPPGGMPPADGRNPASGETQMATLPPSDSPKDYYDLAYGYALHKDYALAEEAFRTFLRKFPSDRMAPEAEYWLGESLFQRQRYRDAAEAFLNVSTKYESTARAPDALLRLGQSLAVLGEKEAACASLGEVLRKYPRAALGVKQGVDREQKRVGC
jgi:tol-pal system protein YbgF